MKLSAVYLMSCRRPCLDVERFFGQVHHASVESQVPLVENRIWGAERTWTPLCVFLEKKRGCGSPIYKLRGFSDIRLVSQHHHAIPIVLDIITHEKSPLESYEIVVYVYFAKEKHIASVGLYL